MKTTLAQQAKGVLIFLGIIWGVFFLDLLLDTLTTFDLNSYGVIPRTAVGLMGIPLMPLLHGGFGHLLSNTVPLTVLLLLLAGSKANSRSVVIAIILLGGSLLWIVGRSANHVGASGLVYGLIAFLIASGFLENRFRSLSIAMLVGVLYGGSLVMGILPRAGSEISWDGHFCGVVAGTATAWMCVRRIGSKS